MNWRSWSCRTQKKKGKGREKKGLGLTLRFRGATGGLDSSVTKLKATEFSIRKEKGTREGCYNGFIRGEA